MEISGLMALRAGEATGPGSVQSPGDETPAALLVRSNGGQSSKRDRDLDTIATPGGDGGGTGTSTASPEEDGDGIRKKKKSSSAANRGVANLTPEQLAKKRANGESLVHSVPLEAAAS